MLFKKCCFFLSLDSGCFIIALFFLSFHLGEMITHSNDCLFVKNTSQKSWAVILMAGILTMGIISSGLLIYGAKRKRQGPVRFWLTVFTIILFLYIILCIIDIIVEKPPASAIVVQILIIVALIYSLMVVHSFYKALGRASDDDPFIP
ncbi:uncharacterized protein LOC117587180 [Drosophila guanche]|uniref:Uncharacterized protein n=1 Tax=Drosophila guanche TaxID=7266 RepID=A0A3B0J0W0_DROGU|nr:uncharacterized protein LOC117587180 [Drosophila guanche]SPP74397.1 Hypothetical predicted protein [Drosophila guanche]